MRKYFELFFIGVAVSAVLGFLYLKSQSQMSEGHERAVLLLQRAKQVDVVTERDLLRSKNFLLLTYDSMVGNEREAAEVCRILRDPTAGIYNAGPAVARAVDAYCDESERRAARIDVFKSKNAVFRNSLYYLHSMGVEIAQRAGSNRDRALHERLVEASLAYALLPTAEARDSMREAMAMAEGTGNEAIANSLIHARKVSTLKSDLDELTAEVFSVRMSEHLEKVRVSYFFSYAQAEATATMFRRFLLATCLAFLIAILYGLMRLWQAAQKIEEANSGLEEKVALRTRELERSQDTITQQQQILAASAKMSALGEMAAGIAHEINNPLALIKNTASQMQELLTEEPADVSLLTEMSATVERTCDRIAKIIHGLRVFCWERKDADRRSVALAKVVEDTLSLCGDRFRSNGLDLRLPEIPTDLKFVGHETQISQVLLNLLNNAHDAVACLPERWVEISAQVAKEWVELRVTDSGPGISPEVAQKLFQPFFTTKEIGKGTGLGLSISLGIVRQHGGELKIDPESPNTSFVVRLPRAAPVVGQEAA